MEKARHPPFRSAVRGALRLRCPYCQQGRVLARWPNKIYPECSRCGLSFFREQGYYIGGMIITYGLTLAVVIPVFLATLLLPDWRIVSDNGRFALWVLFAVRSRSFSCPIPTAYGFTSISGSSHGRLK